MLLRRAMSEMLKFMPERQIVFGLFSRMGELIRLGFLIHTTIRRTICMRSVRRCVLLKTCLLDAS